MSVSIICSIAVRWQRITFGAALASVLAQASGKDHFYGEAPARAGAGGKSRAVGVGDGADDGQAESVPAAMADPLGAKLTEWLE